MAAVLVDIDLNDEHDEKKTDSLQAIIPQKSVPLKRRYPKPLHLVTTNGKSFIIIISQHQDEKKNCIGYDIKQEQYFKLGLYPELQLTNHTLSISGNYKQLYCFDGTKLNRSFAVFELNSTEDRPKIIKVKKSVPAKLISDQRNIITSGKQTLSCYIPKPWNEFHIFGGRSNSKHLKWDVNVKKFIKCSDTSNIMKMQTNKQKLIATDLFFSVKHSTFYVLAPHGTAEIWTLLYPYDKTDKTANNKWIKSTLKLPFQLFSSFGSIFCKEQYIVTFGGYGGNGSNYIGNTANYRQELDDIYMIDIETNMTHKSKIKCPKQGRFYAVYVETSEMVHLFDRNGNEHWIMDLNVILTQIEEIKEYSDIMKPLSVNGKNINICNLNDCRRHFEVLYGYIESLKSEIEKLKQNQCVNMNIVDDEKIDNGSKLKVEEQSLIVENLNQTIDKLKESNVQLQKQLQQEQEKNKQ
eukprot:396448_1